MSETELAESARTTVAPAGAVKAISTYLAANGGTGTAVLQPVGKAGVRVTVVAENGVLGDQLVPTLDIARAVVDAVPGLTLSAAGWTRELVSKAEPAPGHWKKMAGWVANT